MPRDDGQDAKWAGHIDLLKLYLITKTIFPFLGKYESWLSFL